MTRRLNLRLQCLEERAVPSANRLFAMSQDAGRQVAVYLATGATTQTPTPTQPGYGGTGLLLKAFDAYATPFNGGVRVALGDVTGDSIEDLVTAPGPGGGPHIKVFDGASLMNGNVRLVSEFFAFDPAFFGGEYITTGQVDTSTAALEIIVGAGAGGGAHVRVFSLSGGTHLTNEFFAFEGGFRGGVRVAAADTNGDGRAEVITAAGPGGGPHVRFFNMNSFTGSVSDEFFAYDPIFHGGVYVAAGELDGNPIRPEVVTGAGEGGGPHVKLFQPDALGRYTQTAQFFAVASNNFSGARVGVANLGNMMGKQSLYVGVGVSEPFITTATPDPRLRPYNLNFVPDVPDLTTNATSSFPIANPVGPHVWRFVAYNANFIDTFSTMRAGGLNLST